MPYREKRPGEKKESVKNSVGRLFWVAIALLLQLLWIVSIALRLTQYYAAIQMAVSLLALVLVLYLCEQPINSAYKITWIVTILIFPVFGLCVYLIFGQKNALFFHSRQYRCSAEEGRRCLPPAGDTLQKLKAQDAALGGQAHYLQNVTGFPVYQNTDVTYYADTVEAIHAQQEALRRAEKFIFMEYHAIEDSPGWRELEDILAERAANGVEVRVFYDDMGSIGFISEKFSRRLESRGIRCRVFNPVLPMLNVYMNHRDHRKITVVDGRVGFTGGYNLADEYFNLTHPYGHWKDNGIRLEGDAVRSLTVIFLQMWNAAARGREPMEPYLLPCQYAAKEQGFVIPYADSPLDDERTGENVYMNLVKAARRYVYITTPYLIISDELGRELVQAAGRGVEVCICTPGIPDKKLVYRVTRSHYADLMARGVKIYEYTPGFLHQKMFVADDQTAVVGTINLDFRSLYLHFENACWFSGCQAVAQAAADFRRIVAVSRPAEPHRKKQDSLARRFNRRLLKLLSPLL